MLPIPPADLRDTGVVGTGAIGAGVAGCLLRAGFSCAVYDIDPAKLAPLVALGAHACGSALEVAAQADLLFLAPFNAAQVKSIITGGLLPAMRPDAALVLLSTVPPADARRFGQVAAAAHHLLLDCPVSGGGQAAAEGRLTLMVAGSAKLVERCRPALAAFSRKLFHVGEQAGAGAAMKLVNQALYFTHLAALAEAVGFAEQTGVDLATMLEVVSFSSGDSWVLRNRLPVVIDRSYRDQGNIEIAVKDLGSILATAQDRRVPMPLAGLARQLYEMARAAHPQGCDDVALVAVMEQLAHANR